MTPAPKKNYGKSCKYGTCSNRSKKPGLETVRFIPFPKPRNSISIARAKKWIAACRRDFKLEDIKQHYYVCSQHFVDPNGPTELNPDPIPATSSDVNKDRPKRLNMDRLRKRNPPNLTSTSKKNQTMAAAMAATMETSQTVTTPDVDQTMAATMETSQTETIPDVDQTMAATMQTSQTVTTPDVDQTQATPRYLQLTQDEIQNNENCNQQTVPSPASIEDTTDLTFYRFLKTICGQCPGWTLNFTQNSSSNYEISLFSPKYKLTTVVSLSGESCTTKVKICGFVLPPNHAFWGENVQQNSKEDVVALVQSLANWIPCATIIRNTDVIAPATNCSLLCELPRAMCNACTMRITETTNRKEPATAYVNNRFLSQAQLQHKLKVMTRSLLAAKGREKRLGRKLVGKINDDRDGELRAWGGDGLLRTLKEHIDDVSDAQKLFIEQQIKAASVRKRGMRWHPRVVTFCHELWRKSPGAYRFLSNSEFFHLPSDTILRRYQAGCNSIN